MGGRLQRGAKLGGHSTRLSLLPSVLPSIPPSLHLSLPLSIPPSLHPCVLPSMSSSILPSILRLSLSFPPSLHPSPLHSSLHPPILPPSFHPSLHPPTSPPSPPGPFQTGSPIQRGFLHARPIRGIKEQLNPINYLPETFFQSGHCAGAKSLSLHFPCEGGSGQIKPRRPADLCLRLDTPAARDPAAAPRSPRHSPRQMKPSRASSFGRAFAFRKREGCLAG